MIMEIKLLDKKIYAGKKFTAHYKTNGFYEIQRCVWGYSLQFNHFASTIEETFDDEFFGDWLEDAIAYGAFEADKLIGFVEGTLEKWNNRFRISNICIFDENKRSCGIGSALIDAIMEEAIKSKARMVVLETQSCNEKAIAFYRKNGFEIIGFDLYAYSNSDIENHRVRIEMGKKITIK